ncbi:MAG: CFI-box-CTERM domain-containing protein, partial [Planctomycetota bacterium]
FHPSVCTLRRFRDQILLPTPIGRRFVRTYYRMSPPLAAAISQTAWQRRLVLATVVRPLSMAAEYIMLKKQSAPWNHEIS